MKTLPGLLRLNQTDFLWLAMDRVMSAISQVITLHFTEQHSPEEVYAAFRRIISLYPRMRLAVHRKTFGHRIVILDEKDPQFEAFVANKFRVVRGVAVNSGEFNEYKDRLINETFNLAEGLPVTANYFPDDPNPALLLSVHHIVCDGMGWLHMADAFMAILNGKNPPAVPPDDPRLTRAFADRPWYRIPAQVMRSYRAYKETVKVRQGDRPLFLSGYTPVTEFGPAGIVRQTLSSSSAGIRERARELGCSVTTLLFAALTLALVKNSSAGSGNAVHIYFLIDLRPFIEGKKPVYGNYITSGLIRVPESAWADHLTLVGTIRDELARNIETLKKRNLLYPVILNKLSTFMGKKNYTRLALRLKRSGKLPPAIILSNMGDSSGMNAHGPKARLREIISIVPQLGIFVVTGSLDGIITINYSYPANEIRHEDMQALADSLDASMVELLGG